MKGKEKKFSSFSNKRKSISFVKNCPQMEKVL